MDNTFKEILNVNAAPLLLYQEPKTIEMNDKAICFLKGLNIKINDIKDEIILNIQKGKLQISGFELNLIAENNTKLFFLKLIEREEENLAYELDLDLKTIFSNIFDAIYVSDHNGNTLRVSESAKKIWGHSPQELIGKNVYEIEKKGIVNLSVTRLVIESKRRVTSIQTTATGKRLIITGIPVFNSQNDLIRIINISRDITEVKNLQKELNETKVLLENFRKELDETIGQSIVGRSMEIKKCISIAKKASEVSLPVYIEGEFGTGKTTIAELIHLKSSKYNSPFITLNCTFLRQHDNLEDLILKASNGTLFLKNIHDLSEKDQVDMLYLIKHNVKRNRIRLIASSNKNVHSMVINKRFREDLYYEIENISIYLPALRTRKEDIFPLAVHFVRTYNKMYKTNKKLSPSLLSFFHDYSWKGNVLELKNLMERLILTTSSQTITNINLPTDIQNRFFEDSGLLVSKIFPLREAVELTEKQLLLMAKEKHHTTNAIAQVLKINQSNVSRKMKKYHL